MDTIAAQGSLRSLVLHILRRVGIAIGSLVAAWLVVGLLLTLLPLAGAGHPPDAGVLSIGGGLGALATVVLGGLIYRDIVGRERRAHS